MNFRKLAFSLAVLRSTASPDFVKKSGMLTRPLIAAGRFAVNQAVKHNGLAAPLALGGGALAAGAAVNSSINKTRSNMIGFDPRVIAAKREMGE